MTYTQDELNAVVASAIKAERSACSKWLKPDQTPSERLERNHKEILALMDMLATDRKRAQTAEAERDAARAEADRLRLTLRNVERDLHEIQAGDLSPYEAIEPVRAAIAHSRCGFY